jgi:hypothetical protein
MADYSIIEVDLTLNFVGLKFQKFILLLNWRIRLVAYGARLESELGAIPQGFKSLILRQINFN